MPDRRTFLFTCGGAIAIPAVAHFGLASALPAVPASSSGFIPPAPALRIAGWDSAALSGNDAWVQINSSWRATWR